MKKTISVTSLCLALVAMVLLANKHEAGGLVPARFLGITETNKMVEASSAAKPSTDLVQVIEEAPLVEDIEQDFLKKTNKEIRAEIEKNDNVAKEKNFIAKANANELDKKTALEFVTYMRKNSALHKILLERQLDELETEKI